MWKIEENVQWTSRSNKVMLYRGKQIKRTKAFYVKREKGDDTAATDDPANYRRYYYTGFQNASLLLQRYLDSNPFLNALNVCMEKYIRYRLGTEGICVFVTI
jgi:hypothetical protein